MTFPVARILCADDDNDWCELLTLMLRQADDRYQVVSVSTVQKALVLIENLSFDLYILDYALPDGTGTELCRKIRQNDSDTPVMFYSAMAREIDRQMAMEAGANEYLVKPNDLERLTGTIKRLLNDALQINPCGCGLANPERDRAQKPESSVKTKINYDRLF